MVGGRLSRDKSRGNAERVRQGLLLRDVEGEGLKLGKMVVGSGTEGCYWGKLRVKGGVQGRGRSDSERL